MTAAPSVSSASKSIRSSMRKTQPAHYESFAEGRYVLEMPAVASCFGPNRTIVRLARSIRNMTPNPSNGRVLQVSYCSRVRRATSRRKVTNQRRTHLKNLDHHDYEAKTVRLRLVRKTNVFDHSSQR